MNRLLYSVIVLTVGLVCGYLLQPFVQQQLQSAGLLSDSSENASEPSARNILYWVAPMDANYRRDEPGKSPMGMDLVPVYEDEGGEDGVVKISPTVQNNLGVRIEAVKKGRLDREISTVGYITFDEEKLFHLHTRVEGWVEKLLVKASGDVVKKGQKLFELYSPQLVNAQEEYLTALKSKNRILINASKERLISLGVSNHHIEQLKKTRKVRQRIDHMSRNNGFIQQLNIREGMFIKPAMDVLTIGQIDTVWVIAEVFERQSGWVEVGQNVDMRVAAYPEKTWQGKVDYIYPTLEEKTRTLRVRIRFRNPDGALKPNMFSRLTIRSPAANETLLLKREAVIRNGNMQRVVKALGDGKFMSVAVKTGNENAQYIEILNGLEAGDNIVTSAQFLIDSESSISASFERMTEPTRHMSAENNQNQAWVAGKILKVHHMDSKLTLQHGPVDIWGWPQMVMDFPVADSVNIHQLEEGAEFNFLVQKLDSGAIRIIEIEGQAGNPPQPKQKPRDTAWIDGKILKIFHADSKLTLQHGPVEAWGWPEMKMDFPVAGSINIHKLKEGDNMSFLVKKLDSGGIQIINMAGGNKP